MCLFTLKIQYFLVPPTGVCVGLQYRPCKLSSHAGSWVIQTNLSNSGNTFTRIRLHYSASCFSLFQFLLYLSFYRALFPHSREILKMTCNRIHPLLISPDLISHLLKNVISNHQSDAHLPRGRVVVDVSSAPTPKSYQHQLESYLPQLGPYQCQLKRHTQQHESASYTSVLNTDHICLYLLQTVLYLGFKEKLAVGRLVQPAK